MRREPLLLGLVGLGWYGTDVARFLLRATRRSRSVRFVGIYEPRGVPPERLARSLGEAGVPIVTDWAGFAALAPDAAWLTVPIAAHRQVVEDALGLGAAVLVEKPAAASLQDVDAMAAAERAAGRPVLVAYQATYDPAILDLKRRLVDGAIGRVVGVAVHGAGPRGDSYYGRASWAGRMGDADGWILDSPATNGYAHEVHLAFHLAGRDVGSSASPTDVEAELYRANPIESFDVVSCRAQTDAGVPVTIALGHPCVRDVPRCIRVDGTAGSAMVLVDRIVLSSGDRITVTPLLRDARVAMLAQFIATATGEPLADHGRASLATARAQVHLIDAAVSATPIVDVPDEAVVWADCPMGRVRAVAGLEEMLSLAAARGATLSELSMAPWARRPGRIDARQLRTFGGP